MKNSEYWEKRSLAMMKKIYNTREKENKALVKLYRKVLTTTKGELEKLYSNMDNISLSDAYKFDRFKNIEQQLEENIKELTKKEIEFDKGLLENSYKEAYKQVGKDLKIDFTKINTESVKKALNYPWSGAMFSERIWKNNSKLSFDVKEIITKGLIEGKSYINMAKELNDTMGQGTYNSLRLVRTETAHIVNQATLDRYSDSGLVEEVRIISAEDERQCDVCGELHNTVYRLGEEPTLPLHAHCRCCYAPEIKI
ncbi:minor capsid protein [Clostridium chrysemydis]|uniref:minor capsid protein n=1 Tax=Clostridium chrysemydis TaxID=2665504 RepID=UPI00188322FF|nr:minor capsid protein [Clostridium chrysemydis]